MYWQEWWYIKPRDHCEVSYWAMIQPGSLERRSKPISKAHRRNAANQRLVYIDGILTSALLPASAAASDVWRSDLTPDVILAERDTKRSAECSEFLVVSAQVASLRFND